LLDNICSCDFQVEDLFDRSTTASDCCDANQGCFDNWAPIMDESDAFEREVDNATEALASKLAVISFMECEARIDDWSDRELMSRLASLEEGKDEKVEGSDDGGGVDSKLAVILVPFIKVDADVDMEVFVTLEVFARLNVAMVAAVAAAAAAAETLRAAFIFFAYYKYACPLERHCASPSYAKCHHRHGVIRDYESSFSEHDKQCDRCGYCLCFDQYS
jgi:hypothetical protein